MGLINHDPLIRVRDYTRFCGYLINSWPNKIDVDPDSHAKVSTKKLMFCTLTFLRVMQHCLRLQESMISFLFCLISLYSFWSHSFCSPLTIIYLHSITLCQTSCNSSSTISHITSRNIIGSTILSARLSIISPLAAEWTDSLFTESNPWTFLHSVLEPIGGLRTDALNYSLFGESQSWPSINLRWIKQTKTIFKAAGDNYHYHRIGCLCGIETFILGSYNNDVSKHRVLSRAQPFC